MRKGYIIQLLALAGIFVWGIATAAEPIKLGCLFDLSGPAGHIGTPSKYVAEMAVERINKEGGVNGRQVVLVYGDSESDAGKAALQDMGRGRQAGFRQSYPAG